MIRIDPVVCAMYCYFLSKNTKGENGHLTWHKDSLPALKEFNPFWDGDMIAFERYVGTIGTFGVFYNRYRMPWWKRLWAKVV